MSAPPGTCKDCSSVHAGHQITADQSEWVLRTLYELVDYHAERDTDLGDEIAEQLAWVFDLVKPLLPLPEGSPWVVTDDDDEDDEVEHCDACNGEYGPDDLFNGYCTLCSQECERCGTQTLNELLDDGRCEDCANVEVEL